MSRPAIVLVVFVLVLAGCSGFAGDDGPPDREPYDVEEPVDASIDDEPEELLPGLTTDGLTNAMALADAHHEATADASYTVETEIVYATETETETVRQVIERETRIDPEAGVGFASARQYTEGNGSSGVLPDQQNRTVERWFGEETVFRIELDDGDTEYRDAADDIDPVEWAGDSLFIPLHEVDETATTGTLESEDGTYYVLEGNGTESTGVGGTTQSREREVRTLVREDGLVRQTMAEEVVDRNDERTVVTRSVEVTAIGETSVDRPEWYEEAVEALSEESEGVDANRVRW